MNEIVHDADSIHDLAERISISHVPLHDLDFLRPDAAAKARGISRRTTHPGTGFNQSRHQSSSDVPVAPVTKITWQIVEPSRKA